MNVWKMNLKDNRDEKPENLKLSEFDFCKNRGIVGIGWINYDKSENTTTTEKELGYERAKNSFFSFEVNDLVWVKNPESKRYYLCKIISKAKATKNSYYIKNDVSTYCKCIYIEIGTSEELPEDITKEDLVSISTISKANEQVSKATLDFYNKTKTKQDEKDYKIKNFFEEFLKHTIKYKWIYLLAILAIAVITITFFAVNSAHSRQEKEIEASLVNKMFLSGGQILKFDNKGKYRYGSISENENEITDMYYYDWENYDVKISLFGKVYFIDKYSDKHKIDFDENNDIISIGDSELITNEFKNKIDDYYFKLDEIKKAKGYLPNSGEMHTRVFKVFPQINSWKKTVESDSLVLYKNPYNSKDCYVYSDTDSGTSTLRINDSGKSAVFFVNDYGRISLADSGTLTKNKYNELIALAFDEAPDNLKISDLETFKKLAEVTEDPHPYIKDAVRSRKYVAIYKGVRYEVTENYTKEGAYNGYNFVIKID